MPAVHTVARLPRTVRIVGRAVLTVGFVTHAAVPLVCTLMRVPRPVVHAPNALSHAQAWSVGRDWKLFVATPPWETLLRHKVFCCDRNGPALGKLCHDTRGPLSQPKLLVPAPNPVATQNFYRDAGQKISVATKKASVVTQTTSMPGNSVATWRSLSRHRARKHCRVHTLRCHAHVPACTPRPGRAPGLRTISRHRTRETLSRQNFLYRDKGPKMGSSPLCSSCTSSFFFFFPFNTP